MPIEVPLPNDPLNTMDNLEAFIRLVWILRRECPWDQKQTHLSISHLLIEEAYETIEAIQNNDDKELQKELGDLLLHVVMHCVMAEQRGAFSMRDVIEQEAGKLVNRHPHIFADEAVDGEAQVLQNWERLKMKEGRTSVLDGVPKALPAILRAHRVQEKAANVGFDWHDKRDVWAKVHEEIGELQAEIEAENQRGIEREFGDVLFSLVNAARHHKLVAEDSLHSTTNVFMKRFQFIEEEARKAKVELNDLTLEQMDEYWNQAKRQGL
jgi:MazG family protein